MITVDTMVVAYLVLPGERTADALRVRQSDPDWVAPPLWRSELRNVLATYVRGAALALEQALACMHAAEALLQDGTLAVRSADVLGLSASSGCSAYDCEFVALAQDLGVSLVTADRALRRAFPNLVVDLADFGAGR